MILLLLVIIAIACLPFALATVGSGVQLAVDLTSTAKSNYPCAGCRKERNHNGHFIWDNAGRLALGRGHK
jgi:hypothetical protein